MVVFGIEIWATSLNNKWQTHFSFAISWSDHSPHKVIGDFFLAEAFSSFNCELEPWLNLCKKINENLYKINENWNRFFCDNGHILHTSSI